MTRVSTLVNIRLSCKFQARRERQYNPKLQLQYMMQLYATLVQYVGEPPDWLPNLGIKPYNAPVVGLLSPSPWARWGTSPGRTEQCPLPAAIWFPPGAGESERIQENLQCLLCRICGFDYKNLPLQEDIEIINKNNNRSPIPKTSKKQPSCLPAFASQLPAPQKQERSAPPWACPRWQ